MKKMFKTSLLAASITCAISNAAYAQTAPDAGRTLQQAPRTLDVPTDKPGLRFDIPSTTSTVAPGGAQVTLSSIRFEGNTVFDQATLLRVLGDGVYKAPLDLSQIVELADRLTLFYQSSGYPFAKVFVPAQSMSQGILNLQVVEGRYGAISVQGDADVVKAVSGVLSDLQTGQVIESNRLERSTLIASDLPGVQIEPLMRPGQAIGQGDLVMSTRSTRGLSGDAGVDNFGGRYTGQNRLRLNAQYDSPFMVGDQIQWRSLVTDESLLLGSLAYSLPVGNSGLRALASVSHTKYELGKQFEALKANGTADIASAGASYPIVRSQKANLTLSGQIQHKRLNDKQDSVSLNTLKSSDSVPLTLSFDIRDQLAGVSGLTYGAATYTTGRLHLDQPLTTVDQTSAKTAGSFQKINLDIARIQSISGPWSVYARASAQYSNKNLDSSEGFSLGGATGVRAYPSGEAFGDEGYFGQLELRYALGTVTPYAFFDSGEVTIRRSPFTADVNRRTIAGAGAGARYADGPWSVDGFVAWRTEGGKPTSDTLDRHPRAWVTGGYRF